MTNNQPQTEFVVTKLKPDATLTSLYINQELNPFPFLQMNELENTTESEIFIEPETNLDLLQMFHVWSRPSEEMYEELTPEFK